MEKEVSVSPAKRKPVWRIKDPLIRFWYLFRHPLSSYPSGIMMSHYSLHITDFPGSSFEKLCAPALPYILSGKPVMEKGRWWGGNPLTKKKEEIDIVVRTMDKELIACECKYILKDFNPEVLFTLQRRAVLISSGEKVSYIIFTKNKVSPALPSFPSVSFYSLDDVMALLSEKQ